MTVSDQPASANHRGASASGHLDNDPLPDPEPAAPSLPAPDSGVFHHEPATPQPQSPNAPKSQTQS